MSLKTIMSFHRFIRTEEKRSMQVRLAFRLFLNFGFAISIKKAEVFFTTGEEFLHTRHTIF
jgi:hypothetical protein